MPGQFREGDQARALETGSRMLTFQAIWNARSPLRAANIRAAHAELVMHLGRLPPLAWEREGCARHGIVSVGR